MIKKIDNNIPNDLVTIEYMMGNLCNYKCHYCFPGSNEGDQPWPDIDIVKKNFSHLLDYYVKNGKKKFHLYLIGGETTLWPQLEEFSGYFRSRYNIILEVSTNATRKINWWEKNFHLFDHIGISVHHEAVKIPHVIEVADLLYAKNVCVCVDVLVDPYAFDKCISFVDSLKQSKNPWPIITKAVHFDGEHRYTDEQLEYFKTDIIKRYPPLSWYHQTNKKTKLELEITYKDGSTERVFNDSWLLRNNLNRFRGWSCNLGLDVIKIFSDGRITGNCQQKLFGLNFDHNLYSENFVESFHPEFRPVKCQQILCPCSREAAIKKYDARL
jgi:organic radical activating enzyme